MTSVVIIPGYGGSGEGHWQTLFAEKFSAVRVEQDCWDFPTLESWCDGLDRALARCSSPAILVAHSLGCILATHWLADHPNAAVAAALLVAPADVEETPNLPEHVKKFSPIHRQKLFCPSWVIASETDPYCSLARSQDFAQWWGSQHQNIGQAGHINIASGHGKWVEGEELLYSLL